MKTNEILILIGGVIVLLLGLVFWNADWSGKKAEPVGQEAALKTRGSGGGGYLEGGSGGGSSLAGDGAEAEPDGPFAGLTFRDLKEQPLKFDDAEVGAFSFMEGSRVGAIVENTLVQGRYRVNGTSVSISLKQGMEEAKFSLAYNSLEEALLGPNGERYDLRGGQEDLRMQKRSKATRVVNDARIYEAAVDQWAIENNKVNKDTYQFSNVSDYIKASHELVRTSGKDILGNPYVIGTVMEGIKVNPATYNQLSDVTREDFWSSYAPNFRPSPPPR
jgi:hypothetical protein